MAELNPILEQNFKKVLESNQFDSIQKETMFWVFVGKYPEKTADAIKLLGEHDKEAGERVANVFLEAYIETLSNSNSDAKKQRSKL